ncbi:MAG: VWA domain-containing protein [Planctomyces sp.]
MFPFEFVRPAALIMIIPVMILLRAGHVRRLSPFSEFQKRLSLAVRFLLCLLLLLSFADLTWLHRSSQQHVVFALDRSLSMGADAQKKAVEYIEQAEERKALNQSIVMPFATEPGNVQDTESVSASSAKSVIASVDSMPFHPGVAEGTNLEKAINAAAALMPAGFVPHIVLLTDGNETSGDAVAAVARSRIPVSVIPLPPRDKPEVLITDLRVPTEVREGEPFFVDVTLHANHDDQGTLELHRGTQKLLSERRSIREGENHFRFQQTIHEGRMVPIRASVSELNTDTVTENNAESALISVTGKPHVLIIENDPDQIRELSYALEDEGIQVDIQSPRRMPHTISELQNYDLLILSNVPAAALTTGQMDLVRTWVQELGGGFLMLGGENSFGPGGYFRTPLEEILPVRSDFQKEDDKPSLGMVLVIDRSSSMTGEKLVMAKAAAQSAVELLGSKDQIAVVAFNDETTVVSELQQVVDGNRISENIADISAGGGTNLYPAMARAYEILVAAKARLKHVILLTDGISTTGDFDAMARQMASAKITVSTVAIGGEETTDTSILKSIASIGNGRYHLAAEPAEIPEIFAKETLTAAQSAIDERPFLANVARSSQALAEIDISSAPFLLGYVRTRAMPTGEVILTAENGEPLLAWWRSGLGMTGVFTSDAKARWAAEWISWPQFGKFWTQAVRHLTRSDDSHGFHLITESAKKTGENTTLTLDAIDQNEQFLNGADVLLTTIDPVLKRTKRPMNQIAPGRYSTEVNTSKRGDYHFSIEVSKDGEMIQHQSRGFVRSFSDELRFKPVNETLLKIIADVSGGDFAPSPEMIFQKRPETMIRPVPLWPWLLALAAVLIIPDIVLRRFDLRGSRMR